MKKITTILYLFLVIVVIVYIYNYILPPTLYQSSMSMLMGEHMGHYWNMGNSFATNITFQYFILIIIIAAIVGTILLYILFKSPNESKCKKCGLVIESDTWKICPICGNTLTNKKS